MFKKSYTLGKVLGIPIYLDISVIILMLYVLMRYNNIFIGLIAGIGLLFSIAAHELGHSVVAMAFGCKVRDITLMMLGGRATLLSMPRKAWQEFLVAIAGPLVSLILGFGGIFAARLFPGLSPIMRHFLAYEFGGLNITLGVFNLLPAFPMDGGRVLRAFLQQFFMTRLKATWVASRIGRFIAILMGLLALYAWFTGVFSSFPLILLFIVFYIYRAAEQEYRQVLMEERGTTGNPFADMMRNFGFGSDRGAGGHSSAEPPLDDGKVVVSPPPYKKSGSDKVDIYRE